VITTQLYVTSSMEDLLPASTSDSHIGHAYDHSLTSDVLSKDVAIQLVDC
jgi:hypothetical protein